MDSTRKTTVSIGLALAALAGTATLAPPALASHGGGDGTVARGACSHAGVWKLKAKHDDSRIEVEYEVDTNHAGQRWTVRLSDNGHPFFTGHRTTKPPSGSFTIHRRPANRAGSDTIRARAVHGHNVCAGKVRL